MLDNYFKSEKYAASHNFVIRLNTTTQQMNTTSKFNLKHVNLCSKLNYTFINFIVIFISLLNDAYI